MAEMIFRNSYVDVGAQSGMEGIAEMKADLLQRVGNDK